MNRYIKVSPVGEILREEFMIPLEVTVEDLSKVTDIPPLEIQEVLEGQRPLTAEVSSRLGQYFGVSDNYFLSLQREIENRSSTEV